MFAVALKLKHFKMFLLPQISKTVEDMNKGRKLIYYKECPDLFYAYVS